MKMQYYHILFIALVTMALSGCALYPAVQVAGGAMTGYDAVVIADEYMPRDHVEGGSLARDKDKMMERRLRERLKLNNLPVSAHVIEGNAYLVGQFPSRAQADAAIDTALTVQGIRTITCKFFPATNAREAGKDAILLKEVAMRLGATKRLKNADLRVEVIRTNAILIGETTDYDQKTAAVAIASEVGGITEVVDYITVISKPEPDKGDEIAMR